MAKCSDQTVTGLPWKKDIIEKTTFVVIEMITLVIARKDIFATTGKSSTGMDTAIGAIAIVSLIKPVSG